MKDCQSTRSLLSCIYHLVLLVAFVEASCEPSVCEMCQMGSFSCQNGGLTRLPETLPVGTEKIYLFKHRFYITTLKVTNMSKYAVPHYQIRKFHLRDCGITSIEANAFKGFNHLKVLDLSENKLTKLVSNTFSGMRLDSLIIDKNKGLKIEESSFTNLTVTTLRMRECKLDSLNFTYLKPLEAKLKKLDLGNNSLTNLDKQFDPLFRNLDSVNLEHNPFTCNCELLWLSRVYSWKSVYGKSEANFVKSRGYPTCYTPIVLRGKELHRVPEEDYYCAPPHLSTIDVQFRTEDTGTLKCSAKGSSEMTIQWQFLTQRDRYVQPAVKARYFDSIDFVRDDNDRHHFSCVATDNGKVSKADVRIHWPPKINRPPISVPLDRNNLPNNKDRSQGYEDRPSRDQTAATDGQLPTPQSEDSAYLFSKQFTLLEMIGAVVGTFTITLAVFVIIYRCFVSAHNHRRKKPAYSTYEATAYSDCHTYDMPHHHSPYLPPPPPPPPLTNGQFLDFKTQKKLYNHV